MDAELQIMAFELKLLQTLGAVLFTVIPKVAKRERDLNLNKLGK